jgi:hypothetical protein
VKRHPISVEGGTAASGMSSHPPQPLASLSGGPSCEDPQPGSVSSWSSTTSMYAGRGFFRTWMR